MRVLVCGGRDFDGADAWDRMVRVLSKLYPPPTLIIHGAARGADRLAGQWAFSNGVDTEEYPADWKTYGRGAGPKRNQRMLDEAAPDLVVAFPGGKGTADMVRRARAAGVAVFEPGWGS